MKYDGYDIINIPKVKNIPIDYNGLMGVPISFMTKYNPEEFEIMDIDIMYTKKKSGKSSRFKINNK